MRRVVVVHWRPAEAEPLVEALRAAGFEAACVGGEGGQEATRAIRDEPPDAVVVDLSRLPSHGREVGVWLRGSKKLRRIPLVFVNGAPDKVAGVRETIPDAPFTQTAGLAEALRTAKIPEAPVAPPQEMERYGDRSAAQKLGVKAGCTLGVFDPPRDYLTALGPLPEGVEPEEGPSKPCGVTLWFVHDPAGLREALRPMRAIADRTKLWVVWRKGSEAGVTQNLVRESGIEAGLVDYKICSLDGRWSGMAFARKKAGASARK